MPPAAPPPPPPPDTPPRPTILYDLPCRQCAYNLRGLDPAGRCPECGAPIATSLRGDRLHFANPVWLETVHLGSRLVLAGVVCAFLGVVAGIGLPSAATSIVLLAFFGGVALALFGGWLMTRPDPAGVGEDRYGPSRKTVRTTLAIHSATLALLPLGQTRIIDWLGNGLVGLLVILYLAALASLPVGFFAQMAYFGKLAQRIPDDSLTARTRFLAYAAPATFVGALLLSSLPPAAGPFVGVALLAWLAGLGLTYLSVIEQTGRRFNEQAHLARAPQPEPTPAEE